MLAFNLKHRCAYKNCFIYLFNLYLTAAVTLDSLSVQWESTELLCRARMQYTHREHETRVGWVLPGACYLSVKYVSKFIAIHIA